jgi:predicted DNA-binding transcriptional regulator AlpA
MNQKSEILNTQEAAHYIGLTEYALIGWRYKRTGPPYIKIGRRIMYRRSDLNDFLEQRRIDPSQNSEKIPA